MKQLQAVRFAARVGVVGKLLSQMYGLLALLTLVPACVAAAGQRWSTVLTYLAVSGALGALAAGGRLIPSPKRVQQNEALVVVALMFVTSSLIMALPVMSYGVPFVDAWFEAVSGVTTTGLSTLDISDKPPAFLFARAWLQWLGGVGVVVLALALFISPGPTARSLGFSNQETTDTVGGTRAHARRVIRIYLVLTALGIGALLVVGSTPLDAVAHAMTAVSTGGFANYADSLASLPSAHVWVINALCVAGAISFHIYYFSLLALRGKGQLDSQLYALIATITAGSVLMWGCATLTGFEISARDIVSLVVSAQTTAGFATTELASAPNWLLLLLCISMFVGGGIGSTSGGVKLGRILLVLRWVRTYLVRSSVSHHAVITRRTDASFLEDVFAVIGCFVAVLVASWLCFLLYGYPALSALFEVTSALATAGLSGGITDAELPTPLKLVLSFDMLFGRVEIVALLLVLLPRTWLGRRRAIV